MASLSETGHTRNVANFYELLSFCTGLGPTYRPANSHIEITALQATYTQSKDILQQVISAKTVYNQATNARENVFAGCRTLSTRILSALAALGVSELTLADAKTINRKIQGKRKNNPKKPLPENSVSPPVVTDPAAGHTFSVSQQSYHSLTGHFETLLALLLTQPLYTPHEPELSIAGITTLITQMKAANTAVAQAFVAWSNARIHRNKTYYHPTTGLLQISREVKSYIKSLFGTTSPQYKIVRKIYFRVFAP